MGWWEKGMWGGNGMAGWFGMGTAWCGEKGLGIARGLPSNIWLRYCASESRSLVV